MASRGVGKTVAWGLGSFLAWQTVGAPIAYYNEQEYLGRREKLLQRDVRALQEEKKELQGTVSKRMKELSEEEAYGPQMLAGERKLWAERIRRWTATEGIDATIDVLPAIYWQFRRLGKWYTLMTERGEFQENEGSFGEYISLSAINHDSRGACVFEAHPAETKQSVLKNVLAQIRTANEEAYDPLLFALEGSLVNVDDSVSLSSLIRNRESLTQDLGEYSNSPCLPPALGAEVQAAASSLLSIDLHSIEPKLPLLAKRVLAVQDFLDTTKDFVEPDEKDYLKRAAHEQADQLVDHLARYGKSIESYLLLRQAQSIFDAHLATLELSFVDLRAKKKG
ncbi:hypothetical protein DIPPA_16300 [Diplonema papillatum]|nr:hypothetical protein DIPPA_16300 [Diplonema papillatum]